MENLIETIREATIPYASERSRAAGVSACRAILAALEAAPGQELVVPEGSLTPIQAILTALAELPPEQLLDLAVARLRVANAKPRLLDF